MFASEAVRVEYFPLTSFELLCNAYFINSLLLL